VQRVVAIIDRLWALDAATPADVAAIVGVALGLYEDKAGYARYRGAHPLGTIECGYRAAANACHVAITPEKIGRAHV
jgi:hypothetical protein